MAWGAMGGPRPVSCRGALVRWCAGHLTHAGSFIPVLRDQARFVAALMAGLVVGSRCLFISDRSPAALARVRLLYPGVRLLTDESGEQPPFSGDEVLTLGPDRGCDTQPLDISPGPDQVVLTAHTSGSTGVPKAYSKTWSALVAEADMIGRGIRLADSARHLVSTVPPNHMYGFSYGLFGPLCWGMSIDTERPVYPKDLARVMRRAPGPAWVVTTPNQLRAYVASQEPLERVAGFVCSAAPLPVELADAVEARFGRPVIETYGSTETGAIAWRRPTERGLWNAYDGVAVTGGEQTRVHAAYLPRDGQPVDDAVDVVNARQFRIVGRCDDLVKIGAKRASIADLSERLRAVEGVRDGAFFLPSEGAQRAGQVRLVAFAVSPECDAATILARLREWIDPVFLPRPLLLIPELPRGATGKLPRSALDQLWQRHCESLAGAPLATAIGPADWALRVPEAEAMDDDADNAAYDRIATRWLAPAVYPALLRALGAPGALRCILDACSGTGRLAIALARAHPTAAIFGADLSAAMIKRAGVNAAQAGIGRRVQFTHQNLLCTGFADGAFDAAVSYGSLHHWSAPTAVFCELCRVVRPGGRVLIGDWRRDPAPLRFFSSQRGTPEWSLIEASARAAYLEDEVQALLAPLSYLAQWRVQRHSMGLLVTGRVHPQPRLNPPLPAPPEHRDAGT